MRVAISNKDMSTRRTNNQTSRQTERERETSSQALAGRETKRQIKSRTHYNRGRDVCLSLSFSLSTLMVHDAGYRHTRYYLLADTVGKKSFLFSSLNHQATKKYLLFPLPCSRRRGRRSRFLLPSRHVVAMPDSLRCYPSGGVSCPSFLYAFNIARGVDAQTDSIWDPSIEPSNLLQRLSNPSYVTRRQTLSAWILVPTVRGVWVKRYHTTPRSPSLIYYAHNVPDTGIITDITSIKQPEKLGRVFVLQPLLPWASTRSLDITVTS